MSTAFLILLGALLINVIESACPAVSIAAYKYYYIAFANSPTFFFYHNHDDYYDTGIQLTPNTTSTRFQVWKLFPGTGNSYYINSVKEWRMILSDTSDNTGDPYLAYLAPRTMANEQQWNIIPQAAPNTFRITNMSTGRTVYTNITSIVNGTKVYYSSIPANINSVSSDLCFTEVPISALPVDY